MPQMALAGLKSARIRAGLTQVQLAEKLGVKPLAVSRWEIGDRSMSVDTLWRVADALTCDPADILREPNPVEGAA